MSDVSSFTVSYDRRADTLYIAQRVEVADGIQDKFGIIWRYDKQGGLVGATVMDFRELWADNPQELARRIAEKFDLPFPQASVIIKRALDLPSVH